VAAPALPDPPTLRPLGPADLCWVADLESRAFPTPWSRASLEVEARGSFSLGQVVLDAAGHGLGYTLGRVLFEEAHLLKIAIEPRARRAGLGRWMLAAFESEARARGAEGVVLEVRVGNTPARALYQAAGYREVAWRRAYYPDGEDGIILEKTLEDPA